MAMRISALILLAFVGADAILLSRTAAQAAANPIRKVVTLLQKMKLQVEAEGDKEEELYKKFVCYCKTGSADLEASIQAAETKLATLADDLKAAEEEKAKTEEQLEQAKADRKEAKEAMAAATAQREKEAAEFAKFQTDTVANIGAIVKAVAALEKGAAGNFLQVAPRNSAANMDRSGKTVADLAPEVADSNYKGSQSASKGIIGLLEVILSDFDRTIETVTNEEEAAAGEFDTFVKDTDADTSSKEKSTDTKKARRVEIEEEITQQTDLKTEAEGDLKDANKELEVLHTSCVAGEETYAERVEARNKEIEALKEAHAILEDWQSF